MRALSDAGLRPFSDSGYEILDEGLISKGEVVIWSINPMPPALGDLYTIESDGKVHDVVVEELTIFRGGWSARCRLFGLFAA